MRVRDDGYTKKLQTRYNKGVQAYCKARGEKSMAQKAHGLSHARWLCSTTLFSPLSIDEKSFIINIEVVWERYFDVCVVIKA